MNLLAALLLLAALSWAGYVLSLAATDAHRRGLARVHRGASWSPRVPSQRSRM